MATEVVVNRSTITRDDQPRDAGQQEQPPGASQPPAAPLSGLGRTMCASLRGIRIDAHLQLPFTRGVCCVLGPAGKAVRATTGVDALSQCSGEGKGSGISRAQAVAVSHNPRPSRRSGAATAARSAGSPGDLPPAAAGWLPATLEPAAYDSSVDSVKPVRRPERRRRSASASPRAADISADVHHLIVREIPQLRGR